MIPFTPLFIGGGTLYQAVGGTSSGVEDSPSDAVVTLRYDSDGGVRHSQSFVSGSNTTDKDPWSSAHPGEAGGAGWSLKIVHSSGDNDYNTGSGLGTVLGAGGTGWVTLDVNRTWEFRLSSITTHVSNYVIYLSNDGGSTVYDSDTYAVTLQVQTP